MPRYVELVVTDILAATIQENPELRAQVKSMRMHQPSGRGGQKGPTKLAGERMRDLNQTVRESAEVWRKAKRTLARLEEREKSKGASCV